MRIDFNISNKNFLRNLIFFWLSFSQSNNNIIWKKKYNYIISIKIIYYFKIFLLAFIKIFIFNNINYNYSLKIFIIIFIYFN